MRGSRRELAEGLRDELERSTGRRLTERATGVVLSGGLDSSIVTTFAARTRPPAARLRTYSAVFPGSDHDESPKILELTASLGLEPATFQLQPQGTLRLALEHTKRWEMPLTGAGALIEHSYIGPFTSIAAGVHVRSSELEHSIVLEHARIWDAPARIEGSLIGKDVLVHRTATLPKVIRLMVGDHSEVDLA